MPAATQAQSHSSNLSSTFVEAFFQLSFKNFRRFQDFVKELFHVLIMACKADIQEQIVVVPEGEDWQNGLSITDRHKKLFLNERMSDVTFYVGLVEDAEEQKSISLNRLNRIPAHKTILGASSSVFEKMFFGPMAKQQPNQSEVKVLDMEPETFITMLR